MEVVISGIQPTRELHIGNYFGSIKNWLSLQDKFQCMFFIADLHAMTAPYVVAELKNNVLSVTAAYMACGIDPSKSTIFIQSAISSHSELAWLLNCFTPIGLMNRMTQFKEKSEKYKENSSLGLYCYPVLMAADILLYKANYVPVGDDQKQHLELTRNIAAVFNRFVKQEFFNLPEPMIAGVGTRIMSLKDGTKKMSKSDMSDYSRINLTDCDEVIEFKLRKSKTDSITEIYFDKEKRPEISNLLNIYSAFLGINVKDIERKYHGIGCAAFKKDLADLTISYVSVIRSEYKRLMQDTSYLKQILAMGQNKAQKIAITNIQQIHELLGLL